MSLELHADPQHRAGGYGFLELPERSLPETVKIAVQDAYSERWLNPSPEQRVTVGEANWQPERHAFGPYQVLRHDGADWVRIGPEIINKIEEYTAVRFEVNGQTHNVVWPDTLSPLAGAAALGGLQVTPQVVPVQEPELKSPPPQEHVEIPVTKSVSQPKERSSKRWIWILILLVVLGAAALAWKLFGGEATPKAAPLDRSDTACNFETLSALPDFDARNASMRECGKDISPDVVLRIIEDASKAGNADALLLFGTLYDEDELDPRIEVLIGLTFADDPARAVYYYAQAQAAGSKEAGTRLEGACKRLTGSTQTLEKGAFDDFCG